MLADFEVFKNASKIDIGVDKKGMNRVCGGRSQIKEAEQHKWQSSRVVMTSIKYGSTHNKLAFQYKAQKDTIQWL